MSITTPGGKRDSYAYTPAGKLMTVTDSDGFVKSYEATGNGLITAETDKLGSVK